MSEAGEVVNGLDASATNRDVLEVRQELRQEIAQMATKADLRLALAESNVTMLVALTGLFAALMPWLRP